MSSGANAEQSEAWRGADTVVCLGLFAFTTWYCASAPYNLYVYDEGYFLYEAKRIVEGDVFYRDIFDIVTPLAWYLMAAAYWLFGVSMATARTTMAFVHGIIAVGMVVACRWLGVRLSIAAVVGLSEAALCYMANERAAPHWFGTLFCVFVLLALLRRPLATARAAFLVGALVGALVVTQQQRGVAMGWVPIIVLFLDRWLLLAPSERSPRHLARGIIAYAAGVCAVVVPIMAVLVARAGFAEVFLAVVRYPLVNYRQVHSTPWGAYNPIQDTYVGPVVKYLSLVVPGAALVRWLWQSRTTAGWRRARPLATAWLVSVGALLGVLYVPGYAYLVLVGPVWFTLVADLTEVMLRRLERGWRRAWIPAATVVTACALFFLIRLELRRNELLAQWPFVAETPFGRVSFASQVDIDVLDAVTKTVGVTPGRELFIYPTAPGFYLFTGTNNVTRFQILVPGYSSPEHVQEVIDRLETRRQAFVMRNWIWMNNDNDPVMRYLMQKYEKVPLPFPPKQMRTVTLFRRKPDAAGLPTF